MYWLDSGKSSSRSKSGPQVHLTVRMKFTTHSHFHSKLPIETGNRSKRCSVVLKHCFLSSNWEEAGMRRGHTVGGTRRGKPRSRIQWGAGIPSVRLSRSSPSLHFWGPEPPRKGKDTQGCNTDRIRNYQIEGWGHQETPSSRPVPLDL